jgi:MFS family permease
MTPARQAAVPDLVSREDLPRANALLSQLAGMVKIGAPMLAGLILTLLDPHTAILLDALSFLLSALILSRLPALPPRRRPTPVSTHGALPAQTGHEPTLLATLGRSAGLRLLLSATFLTVVVIIGFDALASVFVRDVLHGDERLFGLLIGLVGLGTVGAAGALLWRPTNRDPWRDLVLGIVLLAVVPASLAVAAHLAASPGGTVRGLAAVQAVAAFGCLVGGLGNGLVVVQSGTLLQTLSPGSLLGQMAGAVQSTRVAGQMAGLLITPLLVPALLAMDAYLGAAALALLALALGIMLRLHRSRPPQPVLSAAPASAPDPAAHNTAR